MAMRAEGNSTICHYSDCADALALLGVFDALGGDYRHEGDTLWVQGRSWRVAESRVECGESAFLARTLPVLLPGMGISAVVDGRGTLAQRSQTDLLAVLEVLGIPYQSEGDYLPVAVSATTLDARVVLPPQRTSQVASGVLMAMGLTPKRVEVENLPASSGGRRRQAICQSPLGGYITLRSSAVRQTGARRPCSLQELLLGES